MEHKLNADRVRMNDGKLKNLEQFGSPKTINDMMSFQDLSIIAMSEFLHWRSGLIHENRNAARRQHACAGLVKMDQSKGETFEECMASILTRLSS